MEGSPLAFKAQAHAALADPKLQKALHHVKEGFQVRRQIAVDNLPEFEALRDAARAIKDHTLAHLDLYLERFETRVIENGGEVHWARTPAEAREIVLAILKRVGAKTVTKGKSMISEEIALNAHLAKAGIEPVETDLGEYIIQLRGESPSHIIAPALHLLKEQVAEAFQAAHTQLPADRDLSDRRKLLDEARTVLRRRYLEADAGITGANMLIAETGSAITVTNEGNAELTRSLPRVHIVLASLEKIVPTLEDAATILRVLARSATGQEFSTYTSLFTKPRRAGELDGPEEIHVVLLDNGRSEWLAGEMREVLRCIRCGACMNHCPVYARVGGHAYGWVYGGPIGSILTPALIGIDKSQPLPHASTLCGRCEEVCPMRIPLPKLLRAWRRRGFEASLTPPVERTALALWAFFAQRPALYRMAAALGSALLRLRARNGRLRSFPLAAAWTKARDLPAPTGRSFRHQWRARRRT